MAGPEPVMKLFGHSGQDVTALRAHEEFQKKRREAGPWLHAWYDPVANIKAFSSGVRVADLHGDGEFKLLVADLNRKLKVFKGTGLSTELALLDQPCAVVVFYADLSQPRRPSVAVASGPHIFIYRNMRPYYKYSLPPVTLDKVETDVWQNLLESKDDITASDSVVETLAATANNGVQLSTRSKSLLALEKPEEQVMFINRHRKDMLVQHTVVTCMEKLNKNVDDECAVSSVVVGTENRQIIILEPSGTSVSKTIQIPGIPAFMVVKGLFDVEFRIHIACRNGNIYQVKGGGQKIRLVGTPIELETQPCGLAVLDRRVFVACMDHMVHCFYKNQKKYTLYLPAAITNLEGVQLKRSGHDVLLLVIALANGEVRLYNKKSLIHTLKHDEAVTAMRIGPYGREEAALMLCYRSGALAIKMLKRNAQLEAQSKQSGPPAEQDQKLPVPQKTRLYMEQTQREKDQSAEMHKVFQRDLCKLRLNTARAFVRIITHGTGPVSTTRGSSLRLDAQVQGLGPMFKLLLTLKNTGSAPLVNIPITFTYNHNIYRLPHNLIKVPILVPGVSYAHNVDVECVDEDGAAEPIRVFVCNAKSVVPAISAIVNMPASQVLDKQ